MDQSLWVWHVLTDITSIRDADLLHHGWQVIEPDDLPFPLLALTTQLAPTLPVLTMGHTVVKTWVQLEDVTTTAKHPVILAFHGEEQDIQQQSLFPYPPHQIGAVGLVWEQEQLHVYHLHELGEQAHVWVQHLKTSLDHVFSFSDASPLQKDLWGPVQHAARELAHLYWEHHTHLLDTSQEEIVAQTHLVVQEKQKVAKRGRGGKQQSASLVVRNPEAIEISPDPITYAILHGLLSEEHYVLDESHLIAQYQRKLPQGTVKITIRPGKQETWEEFLESLKNSLGDEVVDTFCAVMSLAYDNSPNDPTLPFFLNVDDILHVRRRKPSNRAFTPVQRAQVIAHVVALSRVEVNAEFPRRRGGRATTGFVKGVILELLQTVFGEYETLTGEILWERREAKIGPWAKFAPFGPQTVLLFRRILEYHAQRQKYAKRFGRELTLQFFMHAQKRTSALHQSVHVELTIEELLTLSEITLLPNTLQPENPARIRTMIEEAFKLLLKDGVLGGYMRLASPAPLQETGEERQKRLECEEDVQMRIDQCAQGWFKLYLKQRWCFEAPLQNSTPLLLSSGNDSL